VQCRRRLALSAREEGVDLPAALSAVMGKLTRQAHRHLGKRQVRKRAAAAPPATETEA